MSTRARIKAAADKIMSRDDWDKKLALAHLLGELSELGWWSDYRQIRSADAFAADLASAVERTYAMLDLGKLIVTHGRGELVTREAGK